MVIREDCAQDTLMIWSGFLLLLLLWYSMQSGQTVSQNMREQWLFRITLCAIMDAHFYEWLMLFVRLMETDLLAALLAIVFCFLAFVFWNLLCFDLDSGYHYISLGLFGVHFSFMAFSLFFLLSEKIEYYVWWVNGSHKHDRKQLYMFFFNFEAYHMHIFFGKG